MKAHFINNQLKHLVRKGVDQCLEQKERNQIIQASEKMAYVKYGRFPLKKQLESMAVAINNLFPVWAKVGFKRIDMFSTSSQFLI